MIFKKKTHSDNLYNILLTLSRNKFFYSEVCLPDSFETRINLMFFHFSVFLKIYKKKEKKFNQKVYDMLFHNIENNLRELGFGDVSVNKKMKDLNKILYDILLKIEKNELKSDFKINPSIVMKYFEDLSDEKSVKYKFFSSYFTNFYNFCFELPLENMLNTSIKFKI